MALPVVGVDFTKFSVASRIREIIGPRSESLITNFPSLPASINEFIRSLRESLITKFPSISGNAMELITSLRESLIAKFPSMSGNVMELITSLRESLIAKFPSMSGNVMELVTSLRESLIAKFLSISGSIMDLIGEHGKSIIATTWPLITNSFSSSYRAVSDWLAQPQIYVLLLIFAATFTVSVIILLRLGFGKGGIVAGSIAAGFQSWMYGGFTPAGGLFATLTSIGMLGRFAPTTTLVAVKFATAVTAIAWACGADGATYG